MGDTTTPPVDYDRYIGPDVQANYEQVVADRYDGDWSALGRQMAVDGNNLLAGWAHSRAGEQGRSEPPRRRGRPPREVA